MTYCRKILFLVVALFAIFAAEAQQPQQSQQQPQQQSQQTEKKKPVLYIFSAEWCAPCQRMHEEALEDAEVVNLLQHMEYHPVDMEFTVGARELYRKHARSGGVPELVIYGGDGKLIARESGYTTIDELIKFLRKAFSSEELKIIDAAYKRHNLQNGAKN